IKYSGLYGDFSGEPYYLNGNMDNISISYKTGISTNGQLAFLRTYGVRHFIEQEIPTLQKTTNVFEHYVFVAEARGNQFRRVSIEIVIHDAFRK
ncbi:MAG: WD40 repeat domain-containing protein, partial [Odoribacter sp.]